MGRKGVDLRRSIAGCSQASAVIVLDDVKVILISFLSSLWRRRGFYLNPNVFVFVFIFAQIQRSPHLAGQTSPWVLLCHLRKRSSPKAEWSQVANDHIFFIDIWDVNDDDDNDGTMRSRMVATFFTHPPIQLLIVVNQRHLRRLAGTIKNRQMPNLQLFTNTVSIIITTIVVICFQWTSQTMPKWFFLHLSLFLWRVLCQLQHGQVRLYVLLRSFVCEYDKSIVDIFCTWCDSSISNSFVGYSWEWPSFKKVLSTLTLGCFKKTLFQTNKKRNPARISLGVSLNRSKRIFDLHQV